MQFRHCELEGLIEITPRKHEDDRGYFTEVFRVSEFADQVPGVTFVQENQSLSVRPGTIRGLHFQVPPAAQGKLVRCLSGKLWDVAVDIRAGSPTFGRWMSIELSPESNNQLWMPRGFAHGFCTLEPNTIVSYRVTHYYNPDLDKGVAWNDPEISIDWPVIADPETLSTKDRQQPMLAALPACFSMEHQQCA